MILMLAALIAAPTLSNRFPIPLEYQGNTQAVVQTLNQDGIDAVCGKAPEGYIIFACVTDDRVVHMPNPCTYKEVRNKYSYAHLLCHELAHVNGWHHKD